MPQHHLTSYENTADYRIRQGSRYTLTIKTPGDKSTGYAIKAEIRKKPGEPTTFAVFNVLSPSYDTTEDKTTWQMFLTASQTSNIPATKRREKADVTIGCTVWCWDVLLQDLANGDNNLRIISISYVEVIPEVTLA
jgi:hypothetical protein